MKTPTLSQLTENYNTAVSIYAPIHRKMVVLDGVDNAKLWQTIGAKFPSYQILPDTNWVSYIKSNLLASIYTVAKSASVLPTSEEDRDLIEHLNIALEYIWDVNDIGYHQMQAGSSAALFNIGITQVGWQDGDITVKNIHPLKFMRDPFAESLRTASYCMTWEDVHKSVILANPDYTEEFQKYLESSEQTAALASPATPLKTRGNPSAAKDYYKIFIHFQRYYDGGPKIAEIHTVNNEHIIYQKEEIKPNLFPFVELYCNLPEDDIVGTSEPAKILSSNIAYNILNSIVATAEYKNQRPPKFISSESGLNTQSFHKYGAESDYTFVVRGDASRAVHYHQFPQPSPALQATQVSLLRDMQTTSGVDGRYTGRDTGSVITTGGIEDMLNRVTLIDTPKIVNYERYTRQLTELILANFVEFSLERKYVKKDINTGKISQFTVKYSDLKLDALKHYTVNISSELPKNKQRIAATANMLMEKQMQYGANQDGPPLLTQEEWLQMQDLPNKEYMLRRMNIDRLTDATVEVADNLFSFSNLVRAGMQPDDAVTSVAQNLMATRRGEMPPVEIPPMPEEVYPEEEILF